MIDYQKLKLAHELCRKLNNYQIEIVIGIANSPIYFLKYSDDNEENSHSTCFGFISDLIAKLEELTKPKPKYEIGQVLWYLDGASFMTQPKPRSLVITEENINRYWVDDEFYPSLYALVQSQIEYWQSQLKDHSEDELEKVKRYQKCELKYINSILPDGIEFVERHCEDKNIESCQHESQDQIYLNNSLIYKCKKCGELYR